MRQPKQSIIRLSIVILIITGYISLTGLSGYSQNDSLYHEIDEVKLTMDQMPSNWQLDREIVADEKAVVKFEQIYKVNVTAILNQIISADDQILQINYCLFEDEAAADIGALKLNAFINDSNLIFDKKNIVVEVISKTAALKQKALQLLTSSPINDILIEPNQLPENWSIWNIIIIQAAKLPFFENRLGAKIDNVVNQFLKAKDGFIRINYVAGTNQAETDKLYQNMQKSVSKENIVLKRDGVVIEIISGKETLKNMARELL